MALRIRRGTDAQRAGITFDQGELIYTTNTQKLYVGDGVTAGGNNILATSAGVGLTWNTGTQQLDFTTQNLGLTTSVVSEGANKYFTTQRAQDAAAALFTAAGSPVATGTISGTISPATVTVNSIAGLTQGEPFIVSGSGGNNLTIGTYYVISASGTSVVLASSLANATAATPVPLTTLTTGSVTGTTFSAGGPDSGITFVYDSVNHVMNISTSTTLPSVTGQTGKYLTNNGSTTSWATIPSAGITSVSADTNPSLGGSLSLNGYNVTGSGNITVTGNITATSGSLTSSTITTGSGTLGNITFTGDSFGTNNNASLVINSGQNGLILTGLQNSGNAQGAVIITKQSRGTLASPTAVNTYDFLAGISATAYNGANYVPSGSFGLIQDGSSFTTSSVAVPAGFAVSVPNASGTLTNFTFTNNGVGNIPTLQVGSFTGTGSLPFTPAAGMIIFDSSAGHFKGYNGTAWVQFA